MRWSTRKVRVQVLSHDEIPAARVDRVIGFGPSERDTLALPLRLIGHAAPRLAQRVRHSKLCRRQRIQRHPGSGCSAPRNIADTETPPDS
jgi:hypothetical protein